MKAGKTWLGSSEQGVLTLLQDVRLLGNSDSPFIQEVLIFSGGKNAVYQGFTQWRISKLNV